MGRPGGVLVWRWGRTWGRSSQRCGTPGAGRERRVAALAGQFGLHPRHIRVAIDFAASHREEIDAQVAANDAAAEQARQMAEGRARLMAS